ncbi:ankyrin repeat-containing domain protein [Bombardia bombarda]|uniref:Ankyrin repeat-containing domain protein n=1 Tax=Bombardia bombarda TaxID=252184 RepID=A0AA39XC10_9PEZI|nr:ankyrin repeat-containing domain protein [Bombardia bombarda]
MSGENDFSDRHSSDEGVNSDVDSSTDSESNEPSSLAHESEADQVADGDNDSDDDDEDNQSSAASEKTIHTRTSDLFSRSSTRSRRSSPGPPPPSRPVKYGLHVNDFFAWSNYDDYDIITVHGIRDDPSAVWKTAEGQPWVRDGLFRSLDRARQIDFTYRTDSKADIFHHDPADGIAIEARRLLDAYIEMRDALPATETDRPVIWICHDIGGQIVKRALIEAALQPVRYRHVALLTTAIVFLGVLHRAKNKDDIQDQLLQLLMMPRTEGDLNGDSIDLKTLEVLTLDVVKRVGSLAEQVWDTNIHFLETNLVTRAQMIYVWSGLRTLDLREQTGSENQDGNEDKDETLDLAVTETPPTEAATPDVPPIPTRRIALRRIAMRRTPFRDSWYNSTIGNPFRMPSEYKLFVDHFDLPLGVDPDDIKWYSYYNDLFGQTGFSLNILYKLFQVQGNLLSLIPPRKPTHEWFDKLQPREPFISWIYKQDAYTLFRGKDVGPGLLYLHGGLGSDTATSPDTSTSFGLANISMSKLSQQLHNDYDYEMHREFRLVERSVLYFEFDRHDSRYNTLRSMLLTFINDLAWRFGDMLDKPIPHIFDLLTHSHAVWSLDDIYLIFDALRDFNATENLTIFIGCFDQCLDPAERQWFLDRLLEAQQESESPYKVIISTSNLDVSLSKSLPSSCLLDLSQCQALLDQQKLIGKMDMSSLNKEAQLLAQRRPIFKELRPQLEELMSQCIEAGSLFLGHAILNWLAACRRGTPKAKFVSIIQTLKSAPITVEGVLGAFCKFVGPDEKKWAAAVLAWVRYAAEPLTAPMLAQAVAFSLSHNSDIPDSVCIVDIDGNGFPQDLERAFGGLVVVDGRDIKFSHDSLYHIDVASLTGSAVPGGKTGHGADIPDTAKTIHKHITEVCLRCLRLPEGQQILAATMSADQYGVDPEAGVMMFPRASIAEYAVRFWTTHHFLSGIGDDAVNKQLMEFFLDQSALRTWAEAHYIASNPFSRMQRSYLSPLPYMAMLGLENLSLSYVGTERTVQDQTYWDAIAEAARCGHRSLVLRLLDMPVLQVDKTNLQNAIFWAAAHGHESGLDELLAKARDIEGFSWPDRILGRAAAAGLQSLISALAECGSYDLNEVISADSTRSALLAAIFWRQEGAVRLLLQHKADPNIATISGTTALLSAATRRNSAILKLILDTPEVNLQDKDEKGVSAVQKAVAYGQQRSLELLIAAGADIHAGNTTDPAMYLSARIPIVTAAEWGYKACARLLLENGANANAESVEGSALYCAVKAGHADICRLLLKFGADPNHVSPNKDVLLVKAIDTENIEVVRILLESGAETNQIHLDKGMPLMTAIDTGNKNLVEMLIDNQYGKPATVDVFDERLSWDNTPLTRAIDKGFPEIFQLLLDKGKADVNYVGKDGETPLFLASYRGRFDMAKTLLARGADVNAKNADDGWTPFHGAHDIPDMLDLLLDHGAEIDAQANSGTAMMNAIRFGQATSVEYLLSRIKAPKPDLEVSLANETHDEYSLTALLIACKSGKAECVRLLLKAGARVDHKTADGSYALEYCLQSPSESTEETLEALLEYGKPNLHDTDSNGNSALHSINENTPLSVVQLLVQHGAPTSIVNKDGYTPLAVAVKASNIAVARYLVKERKVAVNVYGPSFGSILHLAVKNHNLDMVKLLIEDGKADHSAVDRDYGESVLYTALGDWARNSGRIVRYLVEEAGVDVNARGGQLGYPIMCAALNLPWDKILRYLIRREADVNVADDMGRRPIHLAATNSVAHVGALVRAGAELDVRDRYGRSPVHFLLAAQPWKVDKYGILDMLLQPSEQATMQVTHVDNDGWTPLMWLCKTKGHHWNDEEILALLGRVIDEDRNALWVLSKDRQWSPLKLARYHDWASFLPGALGRLAPPEEEQTRKDKDGGEETWDGQFHESRVAMRRFSYCSSCLSVGPILRSSSSTMQF